VTPTDLPSASVRGALTRSAVVYMILFSAVGCWSAYASVLFGELGVGLAVIGLLTAVPAAVAIVGAPAWGLVADRLGDVRPPLLAAGLWAAVAASLLALKPPMPWLVLVVAVLAAGSSGLTPLVDARTVERLGRHRDRFGQARAFGSLGFILTTLAVGLLVQATATTAMLVVYVPALALTGIVGAAVLGRGTRSTRVGGIGPLRALGLLRDPGLGLFFAGSVVVWVAGAGAMAFFSLRLIELGGDARLVGIGWAANAVLEIPTMLAYRRIVGRVRVQWLLVAGAAIFVVRALLFTITGSAMGLVVGAALGGVGFGLFLVGSTTFIARRTPPSLRATAQALFSSTAFALGSILGGILAGLVAGAWGLAAVFPAAAVASVVGAVMIWLAVIRRDVPLGAPAPSEPAPVAASAAAGEPESPSG
jgi:MFS transporter, PPP family, 3-phenylpropionic acid transporter